MISLDDIDDLTDLIGPALSLDLLQVDCLWNVFVKEDVMAPGYSIEIETHSKEQRADVAEAGVVNVPCLDPVEQLPRAHVRTMEETRFVRTNGQSERNRPNIRLLSSHASTTGARLIASSTSKYSASRKPNMRATIIDGKDWTRSL